MAKETKTLEALYSVQGGRQETWGSLTIHDLRLDESRGYLERTRVGGRVMVRESSLLKLLEQSDKQEATSRKGGAQ